MRPGELALVLPLLACLLALSAWPALISESSFPGDEPERAISESFTAPGADGWTGYAPLEAGGRTP